MTICHVSRWQLGWGWWSGPVLFVLPAHLGLGCSRDMVPVLETDALHNSALWLMRCYRCLSDMHDACTRGLMHNLSEY